MHFNHGHICVLVPVTVALQVQSSPNGSFSLLDVTLCRVVAVTVNSGGLFFIFFKLIDLRKCEPVHPKSLFCQEGVLIFQICIALIFCRLQNFTECEMGEGDSSKKKS